MTPSLDRFRREAKRLKRAFAAGDEAALNRAQAVIEGATSLRHTEALHVIAREAGHASWPRMKLALELAAMDRAERAERLKYALYLGRHQLTENLLQADPTLVRHNLGLACALYDVEAVETALAADPGAAKRIVGVRSPILHLAFSRQFQAAPEKSDDMIATANVLVKAGADVDDSYPAAPDSEHRLSALYGALGHAGNLRLSEWLLEHGANPDDNESLYHSTELGHLDGIKLLMRHNVSTRGTNALTRMLDFDNLAGAELFLNYGADPNEAVLDHPSGEPVPTLPALHQAARRGRSGAFATLLLDHGADPKKVWQGHTPFALAKIYGNESFADALKAAGYATALRGTQEILAACADGNAPAGRPLAALPLDEEEQRILTRIILWEDRLEHAKLLVAAGIDPDTPEEMGMPPLHLAGWAGLPSQMEWLLTLSPDLSHVNDYGGDLVGTIVHGSENRLDVDKRNHAACARLALEAGAQLRRADLEGAMNEAVSEVLHDWAADHPSSVVEKRER